MHGQKNINLNTFVWVKGPVILVTVLVVEQQLSCNFKVWHSYCVCKILNQGI